MNLDDVKKLTRCDGCRKPYEFCECMDVLHRRKLILRTITQAKEIAALKAKLAKAVAALEHCQRVIDWEHPVKRHIAKTLTALREKEKGNDKN